MRAATPSSGAAPGPSPTESTSPAPANQVGGTFRNLGATVTVESVERVSSIELNESNYQPGSGYETYTDTTAGEGAAYVKVETRVTNDGSRSYDLTCSLPINTRLIDEQERLFDPIDDLYKVRDNPECNDELQPGFSADMTWVYRIPQDSRATAWAFMDISDPGSVGRGQSTRVNVEAT